jgi:phosphoglycolate phosphatase-like HAD superfamily hydrolase
VSGLGAEVDCVGVGESVSDVEVAEAAVVDAVGVNADKCVTV